jgi:hypothetical protein
MSALLLPGILVSLSVVVLVWVLGVGLRGVTRWARSLWFRQLYGPQLRPGDRMLIGEAVRARDYARLEEIGLRLPEGSVRQHLLGKVFKYYLRHDRASAWSLLFTLPKDRRVTFLGPHRLTRLMEKDIRQAVQAGSLEQAAQYASFIERELTEKELRTVLRKAVGRDDAATADMARRRLNRFAKNPAR